MTLPAPRRPLLLLAVLLFLQACSNLSSGPGSETAGNGGELPVRRIDSQRTAPTVTLNNEAQAIIHDNVWERVQAGLGFSLEQDNDAIRRELEWFATNQDYLDRVSERAAPFFFEIVNEIEKRGLPLELALLPVIESAYDPTATSSVNAVGLWQFMGPTARGMGLKQDWWYDGRRDPLASTRAALDYLEVLHKRFDQDWLLALAAYNAGQGTVQRAIQRNARRGQATDFWSLPLPRETRNHVPRLLGLARLVAEPQNHAITLPVVKNTPTMVLVDPKQQIDLALAAELAGMDSEQIYQLNPGYRQWATHPDGPHALLLPAENASRLTAALTDLDSNTLVTWDRYQVRSGDTLSTIARRFRTQVAILQQANRLKGSRIIAGESLLIPRAYNADGPIALPNAPVYVDGLVTTPSGTVPSEHFVQRGESLWSIARKYGVTVAELAGWNAIDASSILRPGQKLALLEPRQADIADGESTRTEQQIVEYSVRNGDTLYTIARRYRVNVADITRLNGIDQRSLIHPGQQLRIPRTSL